MKRFYKTVGILLFLLLVAFCIRNRDGFTSPGTMVQLASTHVPTTEELKYLQEEYPKQVRHDLIDLTGGDPGPIAVPMPNMFLL